MHKVVSKIAGVVFSAVLVFGLMPSSSFAATRQTVSEDEVAQATSTSIGVDEPVESVVESEEPAAESEEATAQAAYAPRCGVGSTITLASTNFAIDISAGSRKNCAKAQIYSSNDTPAQRFCFSRQSDGTYCIKLAGSDKVLDVASANNKAGATIQLYSSNNTNAQKWTLEKNADGTVSIVSALVTANGAKLYLSASSVSSGQALVLNTKSGQGQSWSITVPEQVVEDGMYTVAASSNTDYVLDIASGSIESGANVQVYKANSTPAQKFDFAYDAETGYYKIRNAVSGKALDVASGSLSAGANVQMYSSNDTFAQRWTVEKTSNGYVIRNASSRLAINTSNGSVGNGKNIQMSTSALSLKLSETTIEEGSYSIVSSGNNKFCLDVESASSNDYANVQLYSRNNTLAQCFTLSYYNDSDYVTLVNHASGKALSTDADGTPGSNVYQAALNYSDGQLWLPKTTDHGLVFTNKGTGLVLDVFNASYKNGANIQVWNANGTSAQGFVLVLSDQNALEFSSFGATGDAWSVTSSRIAGRDYLFLGSSADLSELTLNFSTLSGASSVYISSSSKSAGKLIQNGETVDIKSLCGLSDTDRKCDVYLRTTKNGTPTRLTIMKSSNIATMFITSDDPENEGRHYVESSEDHSAKAPATMVLLEPDGTITYGESASAITIKGRGNYTWKMGEKKPYQIKLDKKTDLLNTKDKNNKAKTWVLLANAGDATLLHNTIAYNLALELGMVEGTQSEMIDLYYDGEYRGSYQLSEKVEVGSGRVDIDDLDDANEEANPDVDLDALPVKQATNKYGKTYQYVDGENTPESYDGGYLIEMDNNYYKDEASWFVAGEDHFVTKNPEYMSKDEAKYISELFQEAYNSLNSSGVNSSTGKSISDYFDLDSLAKTYLINELSKNIDSFRSSTYFYKPAGENKFYASPVWDFDTAFGMWDDDSRMASGYTYAGFYAANTSFGGAALKSGTFRSKVASIYTNDLNGIITNIVCSNKQVSGEFVSSIATYVSQYKASESMNEVLWGVENFGGCNISAFATWEDNVTYMKNFITWRNTWLFQQISSWKSGSYSTSNTTTTYKGTDYRLVFDAKTYLNKYPDLKAAFGDNYAAALNHFVKNGMKEGRQASLNFNVYAYQARYADLRQAFGNNLAAYYTHYIKCGFAEGRIAI